MKKLVLFIICLVTANLVSAQITDYKIGINTEKILVEDNYLYFLDSQDYEGEYSVVVKRIDLVEGVPSEEILDGFEYGIGPPVGLAKNGDYIYCGGHYAIGADGPLYSLDITGASAPEELIDITDLREGDMAYKSDYLYRIEYASTDVVRENITLSPPLTSLTYLNFDGISTPKSLYIDGDTLYIGLSNGDVYTKSLFVDFPKTLYYTSPTGSQILELIKFEDYIYYSTSSGIYRFNTLDVSPITETIVGTDVLGATIGLAAIAFDSGDKFLYASKKGTKIVQIDLNTATYTLSVKEAKPKIVSIYPNPASNSVNIKTRSNIERLSVYDLLGKLVLEISPLHKIEEYSLDILSLNSGVYNLKIKTSNGIETKKIIKQ